MSEADYTGFIFTILNMLVLAEVPIGMSDAFVHPLQNH